MVVIDGHDVGKTRKEVLMDLIYESTGRRIPLDKVVFGKPRETDVRLDRDNNPNTFIPMRVDVQYDHRFNLPESGVLYRRRDIAEHLKDIDASKLMISSFPVKTTDLLDQINEQLEYPILACELLDYEFTSAEQLEMFGLMVVVHPDSVLWFNKGVLFGVDTSGAIDPDSTLVPNNLLMGFYKWIPPQPVTDSEEIP